MYFVDIDFAVLSKIADYLLAYRKFVPHWTLNLWYAYTHIMHQLNVFNESFCRLLRIEMIMSWFSFDNAFQLIIRVRFDVHLTTWHSVPNTTKTLILLYPLV